MAKVHIVSDRLKQETKGMAGYAAPFVSKMMKNGTLTAEKVEILSL